MKIEISSIIEANRSDRGPVDGEYVQDGLIYCARCHTPRETVVTNPFTHQSQKVRCICKCQALERDMERERVQAEERARAAERARVRCFGRSGYEGHTFANDDGKDAQNTKYAVNYAKNFRTFLDKGQGLILLGGFGTGKTFHSACIANELISRGYSVIMTSVPVLVAKMQRSQFEGVDVLSEAIRCDLLILDDLGAERSTEYAKEQVYSVIDGRYRDGLPTIASTNLTAEELRSPKDPTDARIYDRLLERCLPIRYTGQNRRKAGADYDAMRALLSE